VRSNQSDGIGDLPEAGLPDILPVSSHDSLPGTSRCPKLDTVSAAENHEIALPFSMLCLFVIDLITRCEIYDLSHGERGS